MSKTTEMFLVVAYLLSWCALFAIFKWGGLGDNGSLVLLFLALLSVPCFVSALSS